MERIVEDPKRVVQSLSWIVDSVAEILSSLAIVIYISILNYVMFFIILGIIVFSTVIEMFRQKLYKKNIEKVYAEEEKIISFTNEIVSSERDIKSLGLESSLTIMAKKKYDMYRKANVKKA